MSIDNKSISEIELIPIIEDVLDTKSRGFKLSHTILKEYHSGFFMRRIIYDSEWCRIRFDAYQRRSSPPDMHDLNICYGRLHAPNEDHLITWQGETCRCWHSIGSTHLFFLEELSPSDTHPNLAVFDEARSRMEKESRFWLGDFSPIGWESIIWEHYGIKLFELFDVRRPDLWNRYKKFLEEYYKFRDELFRSKGFSPSVDDPPLWKVC